MMIKRSVGAAPPCARLLCAAQSAVAASLERPGARRWALRSEVGIGSKPVNPFTGRGVKKRDERVAPLGGHLRTRGGRHEETGDEESAHGEVKSEKSGANNACRCALIAAYL